MALCTHESCLACPCPNLVSTVCFALGTTAGKLACKPCVILITLAGPSPYGAKKARSISNCTASQSGSLSMTWARRLASTPSAAGVKPWGAMVPTKARSCSRKRLGGRQNSLHRNSTL